MSADPSQSEFALRFAEVRGMLACPACKGELRLESDRAICERCGRGYPVVDGIPVLIAEE
ncbi:MAG TPA: Trm112 family protein [Terracidiphilus sp.]